MTAQIVTSMDGANWPASLPGKQADVGPIADQRGRRGPSGDNPGKSGHEDKKCHNVTRHCDACPGNLKSRPTRLASNFVAENAANVASLPSSRASI